jgi:glycosyltransferase involved in cell wall biosynthesis
VFVTYTYWPPDFGGELLNALDRLQSLAIRGHDVVVLTSGRSGFSDHYLDKNIKVFRSLVIGNTRVARLCRRLIFFLWVIFRLSYMDFDVVHLGGIGLPEQISDVLGTWIITSIIRLKKKRCVYVLSLAETDNDPFVFLGCEQILKKIYFQNISTIVSVSPALHIAVSKAFPKKAHLITYGIRDDIYVLRNTTEKELSRAQMGLSEKDVVFSFLGSVGLRKGFDALAQAFANLAVEHLHWKLWIIGPRTYTENANISEAEVEQVSTPLALLKEQITWFGRIDGQERLSELLAYSDVFVFPSRREGFGLAPLEAMSTGTPVIISCIEGITDLANIEGVTGLYVSPGNAQELERAMKRLGEDADLRKRMGFAAHRRIQEKFAWQPFIDQWENLYLDKS